MFLKPRCMLASPGRSSGLKGTPGFTPQSVIRCACGQPSIAVIAVVIPVLHNLQMFLVWRPVRQKGLVCKKGGVDPSSVTPPPFSEARCLK